MPEAASIPAAPRAFLQAAQAASFFGTGLYNLTAVWTVMQASPPASAPLALGGLLLAGYLPGLLLAVPIGQLIDRLPRHRLAVTCDLMRALLLALVFTAGAGTVPVGAYLVVAALLAVLDEVHDPALGALLRDHTPISRFGVTLARMQTAVQSGWLAGAVTGGLLLWLGDQRHWPTGWPFLLNAASFVLSALLIARAGPAPKAQPHPTAEAAQDTQRPAPTLADLLRHPAVATAAWQLSSLAAVLQLSNLVLPAYVRYSLHQNVMVYGLLEGLYALGALVGAALSASTRERTLSGLLCVSLALIALAPALGKADVVISAAAFFALGLALSVRVKLWTRLQTNLPGAFQGRVHALINGLISGTVLGVVALCSGVLTLRSAVPLYVALAALALLLTARSGRPARTSTGT